jgi:hypothetical protein
MRLTPGPFSYFQTSSASSLQMHDSPRRWWSGHIRGAAATLMWSEIHLPQASSIGMVSGPRIYAKSPPSSDEVQREPGGSVLDSPKTPFSCLPCLNSFQVSLLYGVDTGGPPRLASSWLPCLDSAPDNNIFCVQLEEWAQLSVQKLYPGRQDSLQASKQGMVFSTCSECARHLLPGGPAGLWVEGGGGIGHLGPVMVAADHPKSSLWSWVLALCPPTPTLQLSQWFLCHSVFCYKHPFGSSQPESVSSLVVKSWVWPHNSVQCLWVVAWSSILGFPII